LRLVEVHGGFPFLVLIRIDVFMFWHRLTDVDADGSDGALEASVELTAF
jgi:hypothetical protein